MDSVKCLLIQRKASETQDEETSNIFDKEYSEIQAKLSSLDSKHYEIVEHQRIIGVDIERILPLILASLKENRIQTIVVSHISCLSRDNLKRVELIKQIEEIGGAILVLNEIEWSRSQRISFAIKSFVEEDFAYELSKRIRGAIHKKNVSSGRDSSTFLVLGLNKDPSCPGSYIPNRQELIAVESIYEFFAKTGNLKKTLAHCKVRGYRYKDRSGKFVNFNSKRLLALLKNQKLRGWNKFKDEDDEFPNLQDQNKEVRWNYKHGQLLPSELISAVDSKV